MILFIARDTAYFQNFFLGLKTIMAHDEFIFMDEGCISAVAGVEVVILKSKILHPQKRRKIQRLYPNAKYLFLTQSKYKDGAPTCCYDLNLKSVVGIVDSVEDFQEAYSLSLKEKLILEELRAGKSNKEIARFYDVPLTTVKYYIERLYTKLGVCNREQAALIEI